MPSQGEHFGKVYIPEDGKPGAYDLQKGICFSNLDLKWYDLNGEIHKNFSDFGGSRVSLGFTIKNLNKTGETEEFHGKFRLPLQLGEIQTPDVDYLDELRQVEKGYATALRIISGPEDPRAKVLDVTQTAAMFLLMTPGRKFVRESPFLTYLSLLVMFDDMMDNHTTDIAGLLHTLSYKTLLTLAESGITVFKDGQKSKGFGKMELLATVGQSDFSFEAMFALSSVYGNFVKLNQIIYDEALKHGTAMDGEPFFRSLLESYEALMLQHSKEWKRNSSTANIKSAQVELCKITISTKMAGEAIALQQGVKLREGIRSSFLFKWFLEQATTHAGKVNDLISYHKEMTEEDDCNNEVYILHVVNDWPLEKALEKVLQDANESLRRLSETGEILLELFENDENLSKYIKITKEVICGHLQWFSYITRYHKNLGYDCYIEHDEKENN